MRQLNISNSLIMVLIMFVLSVSLPVYAEAPVPSAGSSDKPIDGELVMPDDYNKADEKKCMTVCDQWGQDCIVNPRTGNRKCRRVCKSFTEECF
jgi:hypothetical protein